MSLPPRSKIAHIFVLVLKDLAKFFPNLLGLFFACLLAGLLWPAFGNSVQWLSFSASLVAVGVLVGISALTIPEVKQELKLSLRNLQNKFSNVSKRDILKIFFVIAPTFFASHMQVQGFWLVLLVYAAVTLLYFRTSRVSAWLAFVFMLFIPLLVWLNFKSESEQLATVVYFLLSIAVVSQLLEFTSTS